MNIEAILLAKDSFPEKRPDNKVSRLLETLIDDDQLLQICPKLSLFAYEDGFEVVGEECGLDPPITLCKPCKELMQNPPPIWDNDGKRPQSWVPFHKNISQLGDCCNSSQGTCRICCMIWNRACILLREIIYPSFSHLNRIHRSKSIARYMDWVGNPLTVGLQAWASRSVIFRVNLGILETDIEPQVHICRLDSFKKEPKDGIVYGDNPNFSLSKSTGSPATLSQIKQWLDSCKDNHSFCRTPLSKNGRPTRLIKIQDGGTTFSLKDDLQDDVEYVAISYRWGSNKKIYKLEKPTLQSMKDKNPILLLPKTLREVCDVAFKLGFEYVWIDRLCIIQDSEEDWQREASKMGMVYSVATLTIATSCAPNEDTGCFRDRKPACITPLFLTSCPFSESRNIAIYSEGSGEDWRRIRHGYLKERGWTLQEWLLSTRVVHFSRKQVYWECRQSDASEAWPSDLKPNAIRPSAKPPFVLSENRQWSAQENWGRIVEDYSGRKFSFDKDMFPAISGLARVMEELADGQLGQYLAGLWGANFIQWLCWSTAWKVPVSLPTEYVAPSWSWASLRAEVRFAPFDNIDVVKSPELHGRVMFEPEEYLAELKDGSLTRVSTIDSYAAIRDGWIVLSGHMKRVWVGTPISNDNPRWGVIPHSETPNLDDLNSGNLDSEDKLLPFRGENAGIVFAKSDFVTWTSISPLTPIYCLPLVKVRVRAYKRTEIHCLLLIPCASQEHNRTLPARSTPYASNEFERVGITMIKMRDDCWDGYQKWISRSPREEIVIR
ncbi:heterokaryon incompatibility protein-domain-containing protein [Annulohypoxylon maeteangense]|uniref:heterokaryon incompatibility protein-domain-containing protein n=1 Tax=Annulohypoxylon maeteangense TaxID=1927788 RepID=UPI002008B72B|nr:heterokaryon incompatibility protein-domain-containing protein [Annulohypoxylon maeteangense]KAI0886231.1 heterokaryon incompatibility protein-domain-containing protein [Annulohypoxylon maeteangense]